MADLRTPPRSDRATDRRSALSDGARTLARRVAHAWRNLPGERRLAAGASLGLFLSLFLPWYRVTVIQTRIGRSGRYRLPSTQHFSGWGSFSFVEGAVLLVAISVLVLLFQRAEGRAFHLPGGDGTVITLAGGWTCFLVIWRMFDKQGVTNRGQLDLSTGIEWGIFVALIVAGVLTYAGTRIRAAREPEPPLPTENYAVFDGRWQLPVEAGPGPASEAEPAVSAAAGSGARSTARVTDSWDPPGVRGSTDSWDTPPAAEGGTGAWDAPAIPSDPADAATAVSPDASGASRGRPGRAGRGRAGPSRGGPGRGGGGRPAAGDGLGRSPRERPTGWLSGPPDHEGTSPRSERQRPQLPPASGGSESGARGGGGDTEGPTIPLEEDPE